MPDEVLNVKEVAALLKLAEETVYANSAGKIRGLWRCKRTELDQWIDVPPRRGQEGGRGE